MQKMKQYQLRYAAGSYWLLDMEQESFHYRNPVALNECGADIWNQRLASKTIPQIAEYLHIEYGIGQREAEADVRYFLEQLKKQGITVKIGDTKQE